MHFSIMQTIKNILIHKYYKLKYKFETVFKQDKFQIGINLRVATTNRYNR